MEDESPSSGGKLLREIKSLGYVYYNDDFVNPRTYEALFDKIELKGKKIIDLGAGYVPQEVSHASACATTLINRGARLIPVDISTYALNTWNLKFRDRKRTSDDKVIPVVSEAVHLPFQDESLDGIVSINLFNFPHIKDSISRILAEAYRILKKDGFLIISNFGYEKRLLANGQVEYNAGMAEDELVSLEEIKEVAQQVGFNKIENVPLDMTRVEQAKQRARKAYKEHGVDDVKIIESVGLLLKKSS